MAQPVMTNGERWRRAYCRRCGLLYDFCPHINTRDFHTIDPDHAARINARYELGKKFDPDNHDTNDYFTDPD